MMSCDAAIGMVDISIQVTAPSLMMCKLFECRPDNTQGVQVWYCMRECTWDSSKDSS